MSEMPFEVTVEIYARMVESGLIPRDRRVYLWVGKLAWYPIEEILR